MRKHLYVQSTPMRRQSYRITDCLSFSPKFFIGWATAHGQKQTQDGSVLFSIFFSSFFHFSVFSSNVQDKPTDFI